MVTTVGWDWISAQAQWQVSIDPRPRGVTNMKTHGWGRWDHLMRASHLYTGLFLVPWMTVYAVSAFLLNHNTWFTETLQPKWEVIRETEFNPGPTFPHVSGEQARAILKHLELDGAHRIMADGSSQMDLFRYCAAGHYRVTWKRQEARLIVQKQKPFSFYSLVNALHFQHGYTDPHFAYLPWLAWAVVVDAVTISTVIWIISGIYLWARRPKKRLLGGVCMLAGSVLFAALAVLLCR
jgi:hypothetical protein